MGILKLRKIITQIKTEGICSIANREDGKESVNLKIK
jgi:hypothetical protein